MVPSGSDDALPLKLTASGAVPEPGVAEGLATGGWFVEPGGTTNSVTLCGGSVAVSWPCTIDTSASRVMRLPALSCQACAVAAGVKFASDTVVAVVAVSDLTITSTVSAPSLERCAAKAATVSGFGPVAATLVSPNVECVPS